MYVCVIILGLAFLFNIRYVRFTLFSFRSFFHFYVVFHEIDMNLFINSMVDGLLDCVQLEILQIDLL